MYYIIIDSIAVSLFTNIEQGDSSAISIPIYIFTLNCLLPGPDCSTVKEGPAPRGEHVTIMMMLVIMIMMMLVMLVIMLVIFMMVIQVRNLPNGEYIVCGEAVDGEGLVLQQLLNGEGLVLQSTCFNVIIQRLDNSGEPHLE